MAHHLITLGGNLLEWYINVVFLSTLHRRRVSKTAAVLLGAVFTLFQFAGNFLFLTQETLSSKVVLILFCGMYNLSLILLYEGKWYWKLFEVFFIYALHGLPEIALAMFLQIVFHFDFGSIQQSTFSFFLGTLLSKVVTLLLVRTFRLFKLRKRIFANGRAVLPMLLLPIASVLNGIGLSYAAYTIYQNGFRILISVTMVLLIAANFVTFWIIEHQSEFIETRESLRYAQSHIQNQLSHYQQLYDYQTEIRRAHHDEKNKLLALSGLLENGEREQALTLVHRELELREAASGSVVNSGNPVIDAVVQAKRKSAGQQGVTLIVRIQLEEPVKLDALELGVLIGNAVDNAIEAAQQLGRDAAPEVLVQIRSLMGRVWIRVENPTVEQGGDVSLLQSTKGDKMQHGYGIKSIRSIAEKHDGTLEFTWQDHRFAAEIGLANENESAS